MANLYFSTKIRALRKEAGFTQQDVSTKLNIQRQTYSNYENATRMPPLEIIIALAKLYQVSVDSLVCDSAPTVKPAASLNTYEKKLLQEFSTLTDAQQKEVMEFVQFKKRNSE